MTIDARRRLALAVGGLCILGTTQGCFLVADLDSYRPEAADAGAEGGTDDPTIPSSLKLTMIDMGFHFNQLIEYRVVDSANSIQSRGIIRPLDHPGTVKITLDVPEAIPTANRPYRLDFYADMNGSGGYDGLGDLLKNDHAWRVEPLVDFPTGKFVHASNVVEVVFEHNAVLTDIDRWPTNGSVNPARGTGLGARVRFAADGLSGWKGKLLQARIIEQLSGHCVALYRIPEVPDGDFEAIVPGVLDPGARYNLDIYIDANGDGKYDNPAELSSNSDLGWRIVLQAGVSEADAGVDGGTSEPLGIDYLFNSTTEPSQSNIDVGPP
jgi:hypothetical protein